MSTLQTAVDGKVNIAQGAENAGKVLGIGDDGNVNATANNAGFNPKIYTGTIKSLIDIDTENKIWTVNRTFGITYQTISDGYGYQNVSAMVIIPKGIKKTYGTYYGRIGGAILVSGQYASSMLYAYIEGDNTIAVKYNAYNSRNYYTLNQLTEQVPLQEGYILYVFD